MLVSSPSFASFLADDLLRECQKVVDMQNDSPDYIKSPGEAGLCIGYMRGFDDMQFQMAYARSGFSPDATEIEKFRIYCSPKDVTYGQEARIIVKYLNDHPEELHYAAGSELILILAKYFPCHS